MFLCSCVFDFLTISCSILFLHFFELWLVYFGIFIALFCFIASLLQEFFIQVIFFMASISYSYPWFFLIYMFFVYSPDRAMFFIFLNECTKKCITSYINIGCRSNVSPFLSVVLDLAYRPVCKNVLAEFLT